MAFWRYIVAAVAVVDVIQCRVQVLVIGGTGNLATKYIWPAFEKLDVHGAHTFSLWAGGVADLASGSKQLFASRAAAKLKVQYVQLRQEEDYKILAKRKDWLLEDVEGIVVYLAVPPAFFEEISRWVHFHLRPRSTSWLRIVVEKPFGHDVKSAEKLAASLRSIFADDELYLIDHYMGKQGIHGVRDFIETNKDEYSKWWKSLTQINVVMHEIDTVAGRTQFFDEVGIVRDVMANHLTLVWGLLSPPDNTSANRRLDLIKQFTFDQTMELGQYDGYLTDVKIELQKDTTTTATAATVGFRHKISGLPVMVAAGKGFNRREVSVDLHFGQDCTLHFIIQSATGASIQVCDAILVKMQPPTEWIPKSPSNLNHFIPKSKSVSDAYTFLLLKIIEGDASHFMHLDDIVLSWKLWQPVLDRCDSASSNSLVTYSLGDDNFLRIPTSPHFHDEL